MNTPQLNEDCIYIILNFLQNSRSTLYSCLLVNRFWCKTTIPLLYANPFANLSDNNRTLIVNTFLFCLNKKEIDYIFKSSVEVLPKTIFEYPKYIKQIVDVEVYEAIYTWNCKLKKSKLNDYLIKSIFLHMFLRQSIYIKHLEIDSSLFNHSIFQSINANSFNFSKLTSLQLNQLNTNVDAGLSLKEIIKHFKNLKRLGFSKFNNSDEIVSIIKQQYELKELAFTYCYESLNHNVFSSLKFQKDSLISLKLRGINIQSYILQCIIKLNNLKLLEIYSCIGLTLEVCKIFEFSSFKLEELSIRNSDSNVTSQIIKYFDVNLKRLKFDYTNDNNVEILETITYNSLDLKTLDIFCLRNNIILYALSYLKNLKIKNINIYLLNFSGNELFFSMLAKNLSETIIKVSFVTCKIIDKKYLSDFFNNCHSKIATLNFNKRLELEHLEIVLDYIKKNNNNLKYLGIHDLDKIWSIEELNLIIQIKERGIKLVEFNDNYKENDYHFSD